MLYAHCTHASCSVMVYNIVISHGQQISLATYKLKYVGEYVIRPYLAKGLYNIKAIKAL